MTPLRHLFSLQPVTTTGRSAATYIPWVMTSRVLAFLRTLLVARLLGELGKGTFGLYQPALEFINPLVALVMFGAADVAERYVAAMLTNVGHLGLRRWLWSQWLRLALTGIGVSFLLYVGAPWIGTAIWGPTAWLTVAGRSIAFVNVGYSSRDLLLACGFAITFLALYQHLAATLRGLRAFAAAAGMEILGAILLLALSALTAWYWNPEPQSSGFGTGGAPWLIYAYAASTALPLIIYGLLLDRHLRQTAAPTIASTNSAFQPNDVLSYAPRWSPPRLTRFAIWALVRLLLVLSFGFLSIWGVRYLAAAQDWQSVAAVQHRQTIATPDDVKSQLPDVHVGNALESTAQFSMPYRIAQLLGFLAVTAWASSYGIAARAWSHGQIRRAKAQYFRIGRLSMAALLLLAIALLLTRNLFTWILPAYGDAIIAFLPRMLAVFIGYALLTFLSTYADLHEKPWKGTLLWALVVAIQAGAIAVGRVFPTLLSTSHDPLSDAAHWLLTWSAVGLAAALLLSLPLLCRPLTARAGLPMLALAISSAALFVPSHVNWIAAPVMLATLLILFLTVHLLRPYDCRALLRWRRQSRS